MRPREGLKGVEPGSARLPKSGSSHCNVHFLSNTELVSIPVRGSSFLIFLPGAGLIRPGVSEWERQMLRDGTRESQESYFI